MRTLRRMKSPCSTARRAALRPSIPRRSLRSDPAR
jgi:hypothetical protein